MAGKQWVAIDFDHTAWDNHNERPMPGFADALETFRSLGHRVMIHSCNSPTFIRKCLEENGLTVDGIWGESSGDYGQKPVCAIYIDDRAIQFDGNWEQMTAEVLRRLEARPITREG